MRRVPTVTEGMYLLDQKPMRVLTGPVPLGDSFFLEAWHSERDPNAGNERIEIPAIYKSFA